MPPKIDRRDFPVSQDYAKFFGEQSATTPKLRRRKRVGTPNERTSPDMLAELERNTGFVPPDPIIPKVETESNDNLSE